MAVVILAVVLIACGAWGCGEKLHSVCLPRETRLVGTADAGGKEKQEKKGNPFPPLHLSLGIRARLAGRSPPRLSPLTALIILRRKEERYKKRKKKEKELGAHWLYPAVVHKVVGPRLFSPHLLSTI